MPKEQETQFGWGERHRGRRRGALKAIGSVAFMACVIAAAVIFGIGLALAIAMTTGLPPSACSLFAPLILS